MSSLPKTRLAIFDIDGTLTDSIAVHQTAFVQLLERSGINTANTNWAGYKHHTDHYIYKCICEEASVNCDHKQFEAGLQQLMVDATVTERIQEIQGAKRFLQMLQDSNYAIVFATGSYMQPALLKLQQAGIPHLPELVVACNDTESREDIVSAAMQLARTHYRMPEPLRTISFGDGLWDLLTAQNLGIEFTGIGSKPLHEHGAKHMFVHFDDPMLIQYLEL